MPNHNIKLENTPRMLQAVKEMLEDSLGEVILHHRNPLVKKSASKITLTLTVKPDSLGSRFEYSLARSATRAPVGSFEDVIYADATGEYPQISEFDPRQERMKFAEDAKA